MPERIDTTHVLMDRKLVLYQRERSDVWQCRYKVDGQWHRATTKEYEFAKAKTRAERLMIEAEIRLDAKCAMPRWASATSTTSRPAAMRC